MKKISSLVFLALILMTSTKAFAQTLQTGSARFDKITQISHHASGGQHVYVLKGDKKLKGVTTEIIKLSGVISSEAANSCLDLAANQNLNSLAGPSYLSVGFTFQTATAGAVYGGPVNYEYQKAVITSCHLVNN